jgi:hypothetical protein
MVLGKEESMVKVKAHSVDATGGDSQLVDDWEPMAMFLSALHSSSSFATKTGVTHHEASSCFPPINPWKGEEEGVLQKTSSRPALLVLF